MTDIGALTIRGGVRKGYDPPYREWGSEKLNLIIF